jgi:hypothetical protein
VHHHHAGGAGRAAITVGHRHRGAFVQAEVEIHAPGDRCIEQREFGGSRVAEDLADAVCPKNRDGFLGCRGHAKSLLE